MHIDKETGFAPVSWQSQVGSCLVARKDKEPMTEGLFWEMHDYMSHLLDLWGEGWPPAAKWYKRETFEGFSANRREGMKGSYD